MQPYYGKRIAIYQANLCVFLFSIKNKGLPGIIDGRRVFIPIQPSAFTVVLVVKREAPLPFELVISAKLVRGWLLLDRWLELCGLRWLNSRSAGFGRRFVRVCERAAGTPERRRCARPAPKERNKKKPAVFGHAKNNHSRGLEDGLSLMEAWFLSFPSMSGIPRIWPEGEVNLGL